MISFDFVLQQETLTERTGPYTTDYKAQWWDEFAINNVETTHITIEILSNYAGEPRFKEVEFYTGESMHI